jgi:hypothetical protein
MILGTSITIEFKLLGFSIYKQVKIKLEVNKVYGEMGV